MDVKNNIVFFGHEAAAAGARLVAVSKTQPNDLILEAYQAGQRIFGENKVQEMVAKYEALPKDTEWHMIGHLQSNKVKYIAPFVSLIHSVDSIKLLEEIDRQGKKINRVIPVLLQVHIASEETKFGFSYEELIDAVNQKLFHAYNFVTIRGLMGMASLTADEQKIQQEFQGLKKFHESLKQNIETNMTMDELSMGMSSDYGIALSAGSTLIRIGSSIFGERYYPNKK